MEFQSAEDAKRWVKEFSFELVPPCAVLLSGELGAGKTQFVQWFLEPLGVQNVASPTFAIHHVYSIRGAGSVDHVDLYRLRSDEELENCGMWDLLNQPNGMLFVEWADRLPESTWPHSWKKIFLHLQKNDANSEARKMQLRIIVP